MEQKVQAQIPEYFMGKNVFITGGSGFIGKVLVEKLLRSCPDVKSVMLLMRTKNGKTVEERVKAITDLPLFDRLKKEQPQNLKKIRIVTGDVRELGLGLSNKDRTLLITETNIVFHAAASVRFDDPLSEALILNTRGTRELLELALEMKHLQVFVHISTAYCHINLKVIGEELYPPPADWREAIEIAEKLDKQMLNILSKKYMGTFPNTYTFAKALSEQIVNDYCAKKIPAVIVRPSIVISSMREPFPGWVDNFNGPVGLLVASGKGILRSMYTDASILADYVPVDIAVKAIIAEAWTKATMADSVERMNQCSVYNVSSNNIRPTSLGEILDIGLDLTSKYPFNSMLWYPAGSTTKCIYYHYFRLILYHMLPAMIIDVILKLAGQKPMLVKVQRRIYNANMALRYFMNTEWKFVNAKAYAVEKNLPPADNELFGLYDQETLMDIEGFLGNAMKGARKYLMKESDESLAKAQMHAKRMWILRHVINALWYAFIFWILFIKVDVSSVFVDKSHEMYDYFTFLPSHRTLNSTLTSTVQ